MFSGGNPGQSCPHDRHRQSDLPEQHDPLLQNGGIEAGCAMVSIGELPGKKQQRSLGREIAWLLAFKTIALVALYLVVFPSVPPRRHDPQPNCIRNRRLCANPREALTCRKSILSNSPASSSH